MQATAKMTIRLGLDSTISFGVCPKYCFLKASTFDCLTRTHENTRSPQAKTTDRSVGGRKTISQQDFWRALEKMQIRVHGWEANALLDRFEVEEDGIVSKFQRAIHSATGSGGAGYDKVS